MKDDQKETPLNMTITISPHGPKMLGICERVFFFWNAPPLPQLSTCVPFKQMVYIILSSSILRT